METNNNNPEFQDLIEISTTDRGKARIRVVCYHTSSNSVNVGDLFEMKTVNRYLNTRNFLQGQDIPLASDEYEIEVKNSAKGEIQVSVKGSAKGSENVAERYTAEFKQASITKDEDGEEGKEANK